MVCANLLAIIDQLIEAIDEENRSYTVANSNRRALIFQKQSEKNALCEIYWSLCREFQACPKNPSLDKDQKLSLDTRLKDLESALYANKICLDAHAEVQQYVKDLLMKSMMKQNNHRSSYNRFGRQKQQSLSFVQKSF